MPCLLLLGLATSGCISTHVVKHKAQPHQEYDPKENQARRVEGQPGFYALLPLTVIADLATWPFQLRLLGVDSSASLSIDGWPVPLP